MAQGEPLNSTDLDLCRRSLTGDGDAQRELYHSHCQRVFVLALRLSGNEADADDLVQEIFIKVFRGLPAFDGRSKLSTWIYRIAVNCCRDRFRGRHRRPIDLAADHPAELLALAAPEGCRDVLQQEQLLRALAQLSPGYREVVVLHDVLGNGHQTIADILAIAVGTSKSQLSKARLKLRILLAGQKA